MTLLTDHRFNLLGEESFLLLLLNPREDRSANGWLVVGLLESESGCGVEVLESSLISPTGDSLISLTAGQTEGKDFSGPAYQVVAKSNASSVTCSEDSATNLHQLGGSLVDLR